MGVVGIRQGRGLILAFLQGVNPPNLAIHSIQKNVELDGHICSRVHFNTMTSRQHREGRMVEGFGGEVGYFDKVTNKLTDTQRTE
jgi:hypothetical protein